MSTIEEIGRGFESGTAIFEEISKSEFVMKESHVYDWHNNVINQIACGDNTEYMRWLLDNGYAGKFQLIYIDPPFFTKAKYNATIKVHDESGKIHNIRHLAYDDRFDRNLEFYIKNMTCRLLFIKELLSDEGLLWVHLDWHSSHYIKVVLDEIFGYKHFENEIVWKYKSGGSGKRHFSRKHDTILVYSKTKEYYLNVPKERSYNRGLKPYRFKGVKEYKDEYGWYTMVGMKDVWTLDMVGRTAKERNGYATQKPMELLKRIIASSTREGDLCGDFFCGSGSFLEAAEILNRRWMGCDSEHLATSIVKKRLDKRSAGYYYYESEGTICNDQLEIIPCSSEELENGKKMMIYTLGKFKPIIDYAHISIKDRLLIEKISRSNPNEFIDYIMVDNNYTGKFDAEMIITEKFENIQFLAHGEVAFIAVDVFGNEYFVKL